MNFQNHEKAILGRGLVVHYYRLLNVPTVNDRQQP